MTALSADRPSTDPKDDLFGHAPFAKSLADSICRYPGNDGLVLALYGPWGSGKSTVLSYVSHYLEQLPDGDRPAVVTFNPWWFSGQENLARAFLGQPRLNPSWLASYIDTAASADRLRRLQRDGEVHDGAREAVSQYVTEFEMLQSGKNPDGIGAFDD